MPQRQISRSCVRATCLLMRYVGRGVCPLDMLSSSPAAPSQQELAEAGTFIWRACVLVEACVSSTQQGLSTQQRAQVARLCVHFQRLCLTVGCKL